MDPAPEAKLFPNSRPSCWAFSPPATPLPMSCPMRAPTRSKRVLGMPDMMSWSGRHPSFSAFDAVRASRPPMSLPAASADFPAVFSASETDFSSLEVSPTSDTYAVANSMATQSPPALRRTLLRRPASSSAVFGPALGASLGRFTGRGLSPLPPPRCQFAHWAAFRMAAKNSIFGVHHHDFGCCARNRPESSVGGRWATKSRRSHQVNCSPIPASVIPALQIRS